MERFRADHFPSGYATKHVIALLFGKTRPKFFDPRIPLRELLNRIALAETIRCKEERPPATLERQEVPLMSRTSASTGLN